MCPTSWIIEQWGEWGKKMPENILTHIWYLAKFPSEDTVVICALWFTWYGHARPMKWNEHTSVLFNIIGKSQKQFVVVNLVYWTRNS